MIEETTSAAEETVTTTVTPEFNWDAIDKYGNVYTKEEREEYAKLYSTTLQTINEHEIVFGKVVEITAKDVVVNIGYKSEGIVARAEFRYNTDLKVGDEVEVYIDILEDRDGQLDLSHKKARAIKAWDRVNEAHAKDEVITGNIKCRTKGGLIADVFGIEAFLPGSQIDVKPIRDYDIYVGKNMEFKVVKINHEFKNIVVSHKILLEEELEEQKKVIMSQLEKGQILEGVVKNITSYGVFIDLGGVDGLIHITDLSWGRINHPEEIVQLDEKIKVVVTDYDPDKKRIALGLKQLSAHPWESLSAEIKIGDKVKGKVVVLADYGAFIEIAPGVEGLIHVSEMSWSSHLRSAQDFLTVGDEIDAVILTLDREERKMSLGIKQLKADPWADIETKYTVGTQHSALVKNFTNYGIFVELEVGVDGLIHISDLNWTKKYKHPSEFCKLDEKIDVKVLGLDKENRKLNLGVKQLEEDPWEVFASVLDVNSNHEGTVMEINEKGAVISLMYGIEAFCPTRHTKKEDGSKMAPDEKLLFGILEFSKDDKKIMLSHNRTWEAIKEEVTKKVDTKDKKSAQDAITKSNSKNAEKTTLGDLDALAKLKQKMEGKD